VEFPGTLVSGVPAALNRAMLAGDLDCGPVSSFCFAEHADRFALLPDVCIGSRREVRSIYCLSKVEPARLAGVPISVTTESATGRALFETICRTQYGFSPEYVDSADPLRDYRERSMPCLVIGDSAIDAYLFDPAHAFDLGTMWHGFTGADMVYAVWAIRREVAAASPNAAAAIATALKAGLEWGLRHLDDVIARAQREIPRPAGFYADYYRALNFHFDAAARSGLRTFFDASAACGLLRQSPALSFQDEELERV
jgi:chorismate dehydratase